MKASWNERPHISSEGRKRRQTGGRSGLSKSWQRLSSVSCMQRTPAGLPCGIPGIGDEIEGAIQHAPQPTRHSMIRPVKIPLMEVKDRRREKRVLSLPLLSVEEKVNAIYFSILDSIT